MHDPMVVAFEIRRPWPTRTSYVPKNEKRWHFGRYEGRPWWRPASYSPYWMIAGRRLYWPSLVTVWHAEPGGRDAFEVCSNRRNGQWSSRWRWHFWHWKITVRPTQTLKRFLFSRCAECKRRFPWGYAPVSHSWYGKGPGWFRSEQNTYHHECSSLVDFRHVCEGHEQLIKALVAEFSLPGEGEAEVVNRIARNDDLPFLVRSRFGHLMGYEMDESARWAKKAASHA